jgi:hypothetical protein
VRDEHWVDTLARGLAGPKSRRDVLRAIGGGVAATLLGAVLPHRVLAAGQPAAQPTCPPGQECVDGRCVTTCPAASTCGNVRTCTGSAHCLGTFCHATTAGVKACFTGTAFVPCTGTADCGAGELCLLFDQATEDGCVEIQVCGTLCGGALCGGEGGTAGEDSSAIEPPPLTPPVRYLENTTADLVNAYWLDLMNQFPPPDLYAQQTAQLDQGTSCQDVVRSLFDTQLFHTHTIVNRHLDLLKRQPTPEELAESLQFLSIGGSQARHKASVMGTDEYFNLAGGTDDSFFHRTSWDLGFGPLEDRWERAAIAKVRGGGAEERANFVFGVLTSPDYLTRYVDSSFRSFLGHEAPQVDRDFWMPILQQGLLPSDPNTPIVNPHVQLFPPLICSDEYRNLLPTRVLPALTCPPVISTFGDPGQCGGVVDYPPQGMTCTPAPGAFFPFGTTAVTCSGSLGVCQTSIIIGDSQPPTILCPQNVSVAAQGPEGAAVSYTAPIAADNCSAVIVECTPPSGNTYPVGTSAVTCTATDAAGNSTTCSFEVSVVG